MQMPYRLGKSYKEPWLIVCAVLKVCLSVPSLKCSLNIYYVLSSHQRAAKNFPVLLHYLQNKIQTTYPYTLGLTLVILFPIFPRPQPTHTHTHTHTLQTWISESWVSTCKYHSFVWTYPYALVLPRVPLPSLCTWFLIILQGIYGVVINILQPVLPKHKHVNRFAAFTDFPGRNTPIMANFNRPMWCHWMQIWEEMSSGPPWWNISIIIW